MINLKVVEQAEYSLLFIEIESGTAEPLDLQKIQFPPVVGTKGLIISPGAARAWAISAVSIHYRNFAKWTAFHDPKLGGAIVVLSFDPEKVIGEFIPLKLNCQICDKQLRSDAIYPYCKEHEERSPHRYRYKKKSK